MNKTKGHPLKKLIEEEMLSRLKLVAKKPKRILAIGCENVQAHYPDAEVITDADLENSVDLIIANLLLTPQNFFSEWHQLLAPEGLLMFSSYGPDTLCEVMQPSAFIDMHLLGDALLQAGFVDPVMDVEHFTINYKNKDQLLGDLAEIGVDETSTLSLTYEIVYGHTWCPADKDKYLADDEGVVKIPLSALRSRLRQ
jgi:SAM-dependent methyltransferase